MHRVMEILVCSATRRSEVAALVGAGAQRGAVGGRPWLESYSVGWGTPERFLIRQMSVSILL